MFYTRIVQDGFSAVTPLKSAEKLMLRLVYLG